MEGELIENSGEDTTVSCPFFILSISSWIMLLITSWMPILILGLKKTKEIYFFWLFSKNKRSENLYPLDINFVVFVIVCLITLIMGAIGFVTYVFSIYKGKKVY